MEHLDDSALYRGYTRFSRELFKPGARDFRYPGFKAAQLAGGIRSAICASKGISEHDKKAL